VVLSVEGRVGRTFPESFESLHALMDTPLLDTHARINATVKSSAFASLWNRTCSALRTTAFVLSRTSRDVYWDHRASNLEVPCTHKSLNQVVVRRPQPLRSFPWVMPVARPFFVACATRIELLSSVKVAMRTSSVLCAP
jgi:hypothetical protein